jgi:hypothetical membrane protein
MVKSNQNKRSLPYEILPSSATMIGACITVITFVRVSDFGGKTYVDDILAYNTFLFIFSCFMSYISISKSNNEKLETMADVSFLLGLSVMVIVGILLLKVG